MRIRLDLSELTRLSKIMMPEGAGFTLGSVSRIFEPIDIALSKGTDICLEDLDTGTGPLSVQGRQVLLYIKDHSRKFDAAMQDGSRGNRFHITHCQTLEDMKQKNRYQRYVATNNMEGLFDIEEPISWGGQGKIGKAALKVCKYCLQHLNYKNSIDYSARQKNFSSFSLAEFFSYYSTCFKYMPRMPDEKSSVGYTMDWPDLSKQVRAAVGYMCDKCGIDLSQHRHLCDVHHVNGVKADNSPGNLRVLCKDCHRKQPMHDGIYISSESMGIIQSLRSQQSKLVITGWESAYDLSDTSIHGDLGLMQKKGYRPPEIGYDLLDDRGEVFVTLEAAWVDRRESIHITQVDVPGWKVYRVGEVAGAGV